MKAKSILALLLMMLPVLSLFTNAKETPYPKREFRGAWIQCVNGQYLGKSMQEIRNMLSSQLDVLEGAGINAILFQVISRVCKAWHHKMDGTHWLGWSMSATSAIWNAMRGLIPIVPRRRERRNWLPIISPSAIQTKCFSMATS